MNPCEEKWSAVDDMDSCDIVVVDGSGDCVGHGSSMHDRLRARLAAAAPDMARLLLSLEWEGQTGGAYEDAEPPNCITCGVYRDQVNFVGLEQFPAGQHKADCRWLATMRKAGVLT